MREDYENKKFSKAAEGLYKLYVRAESLMALNHPIMNIVVYGCIIALSWWGAHFIVSGTLTTGELTSLFTYVMSILQSLMMLSMIFVMLTQSAASAKRVCEVIEEQPQRRVQGCEIRLCFEKGVHTPHFTKICPFQRLLLHRQRRDDWCHRRHGFW